MLGLHQILHATLPRYLPLCTFEPEEPYHQLLDASGALVAAFDSAVAAMYSEQDVEEIENAIVVLREHSRTLLKAFRSRLERACTDSGKLESCNSFLAKWIDRSNKEEEEWKSMTMSMTTLRTALP